MGNTGENTRIFSLALDGYQTTSQLNGEGSFVLVEPLVRFQILRPVILTMALHSSFREKVN